MLSDDLGCTNKILLECVPTHFEKGCTRLVCWLIARHVRNAPGKDRRKNERRRKEGLKDPTGNGGGEKEVAIRTRHTKLWIKIISTPRDSNRAPSRRASGGGSGWGGQSERRARTSEAWRRRRRSDSSLRHWSMSVCRAKMNALTWCTVPPSLTARLPRSSLSYRRSMKLSEKHSQQTRVESADFAEILE